MKLRYKMPHSIAKDVFLEYLKRQGLKVTKSRLKIVETIFARERFHFQADDLLRILNERAKGKEKVSRATVYRTLDLLEQCGLVRKERYKDQVSIYERSLGDDHHDHLICTECGRIVEFHSDQLEKMKAKVAKEYKFSPGYHVLQIFGVCENCTKKYRY